MIYLDKEQVDGIIKYSKKESPNEACGILAGKNGKVRKIYYMTNTDKSSTTFFMDPKEQLKAMKEIRELSLEMVGIFHSHPNSRAYPSAHDVEMAFYTDASYIIVSLMDKDLPKISAFRIKDGKIAEEELKINE